MLVTEINVYPFYYIDYIKLLPKDLPLFTLLKDRKAEVVDFYKTISNDKWNYKYADDKWTVKKVLRHILDAELIFNYRALSIVRGEKQKLIGWSQDEYAKDIDDQNLDPSSLLKSLKLQLDYTADMFSSFSAEDLLKIGNASGFDTEVGAFGFAIVAHELHHRKIITKRYL